MRKMIVFVCLCILPLSAICSNLEEGWSSAPAGNISPFSSSENKVLIQEKRALFDEGNDDPLRAKPGGGTGQKEEEMPVSDALWILAGLAVSYGIVRRKSKKSDLHSILFER